MNGEQGQFQPVAHAGFIVDGTQIILDHLFCGLEPLRNFAVLASLHNQGHDAHFLGGQAVAHARSHQVLFGRLRLRGLRGLPDVTAGYATHAFHQRRPRHVAKHHAAKSLLQVAGRVLVVFYHHNAAASRGLKQHGDAREIRLKRRRKHHNGTGKCGDGVEHALQVGTLRNNAHVLVHSQNLGGPGAEDRL